MTDTQFFPLGIEANFVSYTFGSDLDWMKFSILLLSDKKSENVSVYCLCPVIPKGLLVGKNCVRDLWAWIGVCVYIYIYIHI
jgi:hypothetical protein